MTLAHCSHCMFANGVAWSLCDCASVCALEDGVQGVSSWYYALIHGYSAACHSHPLQKPTTHRVSHGRSTSLTGA